MPTKSRKSAPEEPARPPELDPRTTSPVLRALLSDLAFDPEDPSQGALLMLRARVTGTAGDGRDAERSRRALDWLVRSFTAECVEATGMLLEARRLRTLSAIVNPVSAQAAQRTLGEVLASQQRYASKVSEQLRAPLQVKGAGPEAESVWSSAVDAVEEVGRGPAFRSIEAAAVRGARHSAGELADQAGWSIAVSTAEMAVQSTMWESARPEIHVLGKAPFGAGSGPKVIDAARRASEQRWRTLVQAVSASYLGLLATLIAPS